MYKWGFRYIVNMIEYIGMYIYWGKGVRVVCKIRLRMELKFYVGD